MNLCLMKIFVSRKPFFKTQNHNYFLKNNTCGMVDLHSAVSSSGNLSTGKPQVKLRIPASNSTQLRRAFALVSILLQAASRSPFSSDATKAL